MEIVGCISFILCIILMFLHDKSERDIYRRSRVTFNTFNEKPNPSVIEYFL